MEKIKTKKLAMFARKPMAEKLAVSLFFIFFAVQFVIHAMPFLWLINNALKTTEEFFESSIALTTTWSVSNFASVFTQFQVNGGIGFFEMLFNSLWIALVYVIVSVISSTMLAYILARFRFPGKGFLYGLIVFARTIPILGTGAASFKLKYALGMINNPALIWLGWAVAFDQTALILFATFKGISQTYSEAAKIDGANNMLVLVKIILPQAMPAVIAVSVNLLLARWNDYSTAQITLSDYPNLAYGLYIFQTESAWLVNTKGIYFASVVMVSIPIIILYALSQNLIIKNMSIGGIKG